MNQPDSRNRMSDLTKLADIFIDTLKDFSARGKSLTTENLSQAMAVRPEIKALIASPQTSGDEIALPETEALQKRMNRVMEQKEAALAHLREVEERASQEDDFFRRAMLSMIRLVGGSDNEALGAALDFLREKVVDGAGVNDLEEAVQAVKNGVLKSDQDQANLTSAPAWKRMLKGGSAAQADDATSKWLAEVKRAYLELLAEIDLDLGQEYLDRLNSVRRRIASSDDLDYLLSLRFEVEDLVSLFARQVFEERDKAAAFIAEVAQRLTDMASHLTISVSYTQGMYQANAAFNSDLETEIKEVSASVQESQRLEELKKLVLSRLSAVGEAIEKKRQEDRGRHEEVEQELTHLRQKVETAQTKVNQVQKENKALARKLQIDPLTGAFNRRAYKENLIAEFERYQRSGRVFSVIMMDVDHFKRINDAYGHQVGDKCLKEVIKRVRPLLRKSDLLARYGGEEFVVLLPDTDRTAGREVADKLRRVIELTEFLHRGKPVALTISLGVSQIRSADAQAEDVIERADKALYEAKGAGRNRVAAL